MTIDSNTIATSVIGTLIVHIALWNARQLSGIRRTLAAICTRLALHDQALDLDTTKYQPKDNGQP